MYGKELRYYFTTPVAYIVIGLFLLLQWLFLWVLPGEWNVIDSGYAQVDGLFAIVPWLLLLVCPALTMRLFAEERQRGTWALLMTKDIALWRVVTAKYMAAWTVVVIALLPSLLHWAAVWLIAEPQGNVDSGAFFGSFAGLLFVSMAYTAVGLFFSTLSKSQIVSFILSVLGCAVFFYGFDLMAMAVRNAEAVGVISLFGGNRHYTDMARGVLDLRDVVYFLSVAVLFVCSSIISLSKKND